MATLFQVFVPKLAIITLVFFHFIASHTVLENSHIRVLPVLVILSCFCSVRILAYRKTPSDHNVSYGYYHIRQRFYRQTYRNSSRTLDFVRTQ